MMFSFDIIHYTGFQGLLPIWLTFLVVQTVFSLKTHESFAHGNTGSLVVQQWRTQLEFEDFVNVAVLVASHKVHQITIDFSNKTVCSGDSRLIQLAGSNVTDERIKTLYGPDEIVIKVEGKELHSQLAKYTSCRSYRNSFHISNSGAYHIKIVLLRGNYSALSEMVPVFPRVQYVTLLSEWVYLNETASHRHAQHHHHSSSQCSKHSHTGGTWVEKATLTDSGKDSIFNDLKSAQSIAPIANRGGDDRGALPPLLSHVPLGSEHVQKGCLPEVDKYTWITQPQSQQQSQQQQSTNCPQNYLYNSSEAAALLVNKKIQLHGDSHMRNFGSFFLHWACEMPMKDLFEKGMNKHIFVSETAERCAGLHIQYDPNYFCYNLGRPGSNRKNAFFPDLTLLNCGHHPAGSEQTPLNIYLEMVQNHINHHIANPENGYNSSTFVWMESVPQPVRQDKWVIEAKDWRTLHRLQVYNDYSNELFKQHNYTVISQFNALLPLYEAGCDFAHYTAIGALYPVFQQVLAILST